jgi:hypothetical protein
VGQTPTQVKTNMTVANLVHSNIVRPRCPIYRTESFRTAKAKRCTVGILVFAISLAGFLYVFATNNIAVKGYKISSLQKQANELETINKNLQVEVSNLKSINVLEAMSEDLEMVKAQKIEYVSLPKASAMK